MTRILARLALGDETVLLRRAAPADLPALVRLLADDQLGATRDVYDAALPDAYREAFATIDADQAHLLVAGEIAEAPGTIVATMQLTVLPGLARRGSTRLQIEAVRVDSGHRGRGVGRAMTGWAIEEARRRGCALVQLTSDKRRPDAHRFYARLGFVASHEGFKLRLDDAGR